MRLLALALLLTLPVVQADLEGADALLEATYLADQPGAAVIVTKGENVLYRGARGLADIELGVAIEPDMVFRLGSITKQITAAATMQLVEQGKIALDDPITKFLPAYPTQGKTITVEHLLTHTSGIQSYTNMPGWMAEKIRSDLSLDELIDGFDQEPMEFDPGSAYNYNNSGYVLLGAVIEKGSGMSYESYVEQKIFAPLGMEHSRYGHHLELVPRRVSGYDGDPASPTNARFISMTQPHAAGSLISNVDDMARWNRALFAHEVVNEASLAAMTTPYTLADDSETRYGYGLAFGEVRGRPTIEHGGGIFGFSTFGLYIPEEDLYVAVLSNVTGHATAPGMVANQLAALALGEPYPLRKRVAVPADTLERYLGVYRIDDHTTRTVTVEGDKLYTRRSGGQRLEAIPASETRFFYGSSLTWFDFETDDAGAVTGMRMHQNGANEGEWAARTAEKPVARPSIDLDEKQIAALVGRYELAAGFILELRHEGGRVFAQATGQGSFPLAAESPDTLYSEVVGATLTFEFGEDGRATQLTLRQAGQVIPAPRVE